MLHLFRENFIGVNFAVILCCAIFTSIILVVIILKQKQTTEIKNFILFTLASALAQWTDIVVYLCVGNSELIHLNYIVNVLSYALSVFASYLYLIYLFAYFEDRRKIKYHKLYRQVPFIYMVICIAIYTSSIWNDLFFRIDTAGYYHSTQLSFLSSAMLLPVALFSFFEILKNRKYTSKRDSVIHFLYNIFYLALGIIDSAKSLTLHYIAMTVFVLLIFVFIGLEKEQELEKNQKELALSELNALRLQMNPHFIYNTLASVDALITVDPEAARDLVEKFIKHLRGSYLDNSPLLVPFADELENIKYYLSVEQTRFPGIKIDYDLKITDFQLPPLTVQPLIENAIKHGICGRDESEGTITISAYDDEKAYYIRIADNGIGFDTKAPLIPSKRNHLGVQTTKKRLELICKGTLDITSIVNVGTQSLITIPKESI